MESELHLGFEYFVALELFLLFSLSLQQEDYRSLLQQPSKTKDKILEALEYSLHVELRRPLFFNRLRPFFKPCWSKWGLPLNGCNTGPWTRVQICADQNTQSTVWQQQALGGPIAE